MAEYFGALVEAGNEDGDDNDKDDNDTDTDCPLGLLATTTTQ